MSKVLHARKRVKYANDVDYATKRSCEGWLRRTHGLDRQWHFRTRWSTRAKAMQRAGQSVFGTNSQGAADEAPRARRMGIGRGETRKIRVGGRRDSCRCVSNHHGVGCRRWRELSAVTKSACVGRRACRVDDEATARSAIPKREERLRWAANGILDGKGLAARGLGTREAEVQARQWRGGSEMQSHHRD